MSHVAATPSFARSSPPTSGRSRPRGGPASSPAPPRASSLVLALVLASTIGVGRAHALAFVNDAPVVSDTTTILGQVRQNLDLTKKTNACFQATQAATGSVGPNAGCTGAPKMPTSCPGGTPTQASPSQASTPATPSTPSAPSPAGLAGGAGSTGAAPAAISAGSGGAAGAGAAGASPSSPNASVPGQVTGLIGGGYLAAGLGANGLPTQAASQAAGQAAGAPPASSVPATPSIPGSCKGTSSMVKSAGLTSGANGMTPALQSNAALSTPSSTSSLSATLGKLNAVINGQVTGSQAITQLQSILYVDATAAPTAQQVEAVNDIRRLNIQNASIEALAAALQAKNAAANLSGGTLSAMMSDAGKTQDVRGDLAANITAMLKMLEQAVVQNGLLAADLHLECAVQIGNDGLNGRDGGHQQNLQASGTTTASSK